MSDKMLRVAAVAASRVAVLGLAASWLAPSAARAELGGSLASVEADRGHMGARLSSQPQGRALRHELTRTNGGTVHELTNAEGQVFAVTWSGPGKPDLRQVLGRYFAAYQAAAVAGSGRAAHGFRRPVQVSQPDLQIQSEGHMGWFRGVAYVPSLAPAGFTGADLPDER